MKRGISIIVILAFSLFAKGQNVGVGIAAPNDLFHVYGTSASMGILFNNVTTGSTATNGLSITIDGSKNVLFKQQESAQMQFLISGLVRMYIDKNGFVGINSAPVTGVQLLGSTSTVDYSGLMGVGNGGSSVLPGATGFGVVGSVGTGNPNVGVGGFYGGNVDIGSGGAGIFGSSKGTSGTSYGVYGIATGTATNNAAYFTASGGTNNYAIIVPNGGGSVGIGTTAPDASSILDMSGISTKGMLIPKVALTASNVAGPISSPATSLLVYNTATAGSSPNNVTPGFYYNAGTSASPNWEQLLVSASAVSAGWLTTGNSSMATGSFASPGANFIGTTDNNDFPIRTNNIERMRVASAGAIGINISPVTSYQLDVTNSASLGTGLAGIYGTYTTSASGTGGAGVVGIGNGAVYPSTFNGSVGVLGAVGTSSGSAGVAGYAGGAGWSSPVVAGVYGESTLNTTNAIYGINSAPAGAGTTSNKGNGVYGSTRQSQSSGVYGTNNFGGPGVSGISVSNGASIYGDGVYGESDGNGVVGFTKAIGASAINYSGVYGYYLPTPTASGVGGVAGVLGFNQNTTATNGNIGVEGYYEFTGIPYGIGVLGSGYGGISSTTTLQGDFGVLGNIGGTRNSGAGSAAVAGFIGTPATFTNPDAAVFGSSTIATDWALSGTNGTGATGNGLLVNGISNLIGILTLGANANTTYSSKTNGALVFDNTSNLKTVTIQSGVTVTPGYTLTLPTSLPLTNGQALVTSTAGTLSWSAVGSGTVTSATGTAPIYVASGTTTPSITIQGVVAGDKGGVLYSTGTSTSALFNTTGTAGQVLLSGNTASPSWNNISGIVTANNGLSYSGTTTENIALGGALTQTTTITQAGFDLIDNLNGVGDFRIQKSGTEVLDVLNTGQALINPSAAPSIPVATSNLLLSVNGNSYSDNQVSVIPLFSGGFKYNVSNTSGQDIANIETGIQPCTYRKDGWVQVQMVVYYTDNNAGNVNLQLETDGSGSTNYPIVNTDSWTFANTTGSASTGNYVATSPWKDINLGLNALEAHLNMWVQFNSIDIKNVYLFIRPKNN